jgi:transcriptional regulator with XRE-family HTH domain
MWSSRFLVHRFNNNTYYDFAKGLINEVCINLIGKMPATLFAVSRILMFGVKRYVMSSKLEQREKLAALLMAHCRANNLSGTRLAQLIKVSQPSAQAYLDGRTYPSEEVRRRIAKVLGVTIEELQSELDGVEPDRQLTSEAIAREIRQMSQADFLRLLPVVFERILNLLIRSSDPDGK